MSPDRWLPTRSVDPPPLLEDCLFDDGVTAEQTHLPALSLRRCRVSRPDQRPCTPTASTSMASWHSPCRPPAIGLISLPMLASCPDRPGWPSRRRVAVRVQSSPPRRRRAADPAFAQAARRRGLGAGLGGGRVSQLRRTASASAWERRRGAAVLGVGRSEIG
jgi:hypothetical protein